MNCYGIKGNLLKWFENYLGLLLFLVYINDIGDKLLSLSRLFVDDTSLGYASQYEAQIKYVINHDLHELGDWSKRWLMSFNPDKTEIMLFKNVENTTNFNFYFDGKLIPLTSDHIYLGITFSEEAKWNKHVENLIKSVSKHICVLRKLKYKLNRQHLEKIYLIYNRPIFENACEVWDNCAIRANWRDHSWKAARIITRLPIFTNTEYLYRETGWERLEERRTRRKLQLFYNIQNGSTHPYLLDLYPPPQSKVRLFFTPFEMATILLFHSIDFLF